MRTCLVLVVLLALPVAALGQEVVNVLVVDETEGLIESLAVNTLVGLLRQQTESFGTIDTVITPVVSPFDLPFLTNPTGKSYDLVVVVPQGVLALRTVWLVTGPYPQNHPALWAAMAFMRELAVQFGAQFNLSLALQDVNENLFAAILAGFFARIGVLNWGTSP